MGLDLWEYHSVKTGNFVEILKLLDETALIGKSHLQNVTDWPTQFEPPLFRKNFMSPPNELKQAIRPDLDQNEYQYEQQAFGIKSVQKCQHHITGLTTTILFFTSWGK